MAMTETSRQVGVVLRRRRIDNPWIDHMWSPAMILDEVPDFVFIEILEQGSTFEMSGTNGAKMARIGRDVVASSLPAALMFELSRGL